MRTSDHETNQSTQPDFQAGLDDLEKGGYTITTKELQLLAEMGDVGALILLDRGPYPLGTFDVPFARAHIDRNTFWRDVLD